MAGDETPGGHSPGLERTLGTGLLAIYGAGTILGAGIYVLIGELAGEAGWWLPVAFLLAAAAASVTGLAYAELSTRVPRAGGPSEYVARAFDRAWFSVVIGWMIVATGVVSAATIATGFAGYLSAFLDLPDALVVTGLLTSMTVVAIAGARQSAWFMALTTVLGVAGLLIVIAAGFLGEAADPARIPDQAGSLFEAATFTGVATATFLAVYAFIGFEDMVHMAEEVHHPARSMPRAIMIALGSAALLYVVVAIAALSVIEPRGLAAAEAPLVEVVEATGWPGWPVAALSLWIIANGALAQIIMSSRVVYSLRDRKGVPGALATIWSRTDTPALATAAAGAVALGLALTLPLKTLAAVTSFVMLLVFVASNAALIVLERREPEAPFDTPRALPWAGLVISAALAGSSLLIGGV